MSEYKDISEEHVLEVENKIKNAPTMKEIWNIINETFPNWVINISDCYSEDYIHLEQNFNYLKKNNKYSLNLKKFFLFWVLPLYNEDLLIVLEAITIILFIVTVRSVLGTVKDPESILHLI